MFKKLKKQNNKGFTLVELLVVIAIIGILAVVAVPSLMKNIDKAKAGDVVAECNAIRTAAITYYADNGKLPADNTAIAANLDNLDEKKYTVTGDNEKSTLTVVIKEAGKGTVKTRVEESLGKAATVSVSGDDLQVVFTLK